jgi:hypothetical protein
VGATGSERERERSIKKVVTKEINAFESTAQHGAT